MVRILIIEDELIISRDMTAMLTRMGYEVIGDAMDFDEAIEILERETPDLILLDINLNGKRDGIEVAAEINRRFQIPFIFTTSYSDAATLERARKTNPVNYLVKPFKQEQLYTAIEMGLFKAADLQNTSEFANQKPIVTDEDEKPVIIKGVLFIKDKFTYSKLIVADIRWIKSDGNYLEIYTSTSKPALLRASMGSFMERLGDDFLRIHKSYIINLQHLTKFEANNVTVDNEVIPISKNYSEDLLRRLDIF
ncbi:MAG TPA: response regulator [Flavobacterium sp.]|jgi:DNA-binding LytR/AlgR family response regulator